MSFDPEQKGYRIGAEEAGCLVADEQHLAGTLKAQRGKGGGGIGPEETLVAGPLATGQTPKGHGMAGVNDQAVEANHIVPAVPISADALRGEGEAKTPSADAEGNVRLRDPGLGVGTPGDPAFTIAAASPGAVAAPLSHGSNPNSNAAGRRREDDENLAVAFPTLGADYARQAGGHPGAEENARALSEVGASVRRLTPTECERLQALPDGWTQLGETPDSRRYAGLGDAVTASVGRWIGARIFRAEEAVRASA